MGSNIPEDLKVRIEEALNAIFEYIDYHVEYDPSSESLQSWIQSGDRKNKGLCRDCGQVLSYTSERRFPTFGFCRCKSPICTLCITRSLTHHKCNQCKGSVIIPSKDTAMLLARVKAFMDSREIQNIDLRPEEPEGFEGKRFHS